MIYKIAFKNFFSFKDYFEVNFSADKNSPDTTTYFYDNFKNKITKVLAIIGPNASGKTNLMRVLSFMPWFMCSSFESTTEYIDFKKFLFTKEDNPTELYIEFGDKTKIFKYNLVLNNKMVISEELYLKDVKRFKKVFTRKFIPKENKYKYDFREKDDILRSLNMDTLRNNCSFISWSKQYNYDISINIYNIFHNMFINVSENGTNPEFVKILSGIDYYEKNQDIKNKALEFLKKFDIGIDNIIIERIKNDNKQPLFNISSNHVINGENYPLAFTYESSGSQNLFFLLKDIILALDMGGVAIIDEIDNNLHPLLVEGIINLFKSEKYNPNNAQIIFSSHSISLLNELDKQQILFVEKDPITQASSCYSLKDISGVRVDENFYIKYMTGKYGAIPNL